jgi:hypothetical protein
MLLRNILEVPPSRPKQRPIAIVTDAGWDAMDEARIARDHKMAGQDASRRPVSLVRLFEILAV